MHTSRAPKPGTPHSSRLSYNLGQNKMEQKTPFPPKSKMKTREGQKRAIFPSLIWGGGRGGSRFSIYFVQDCSSFNMLTLMK